MTTDTCDHMITDTDSLKYKIFDWWKEKEKEKELLSTIVQPFYIAILVLLWQMLSSI